MLGSGSPSLFGTDFIQQFLTDAKPQLEALVRDVISKSQGATETLCVDYEEAGRRIGITYEGIRKLVRNGKLMSVSISGRRRGISVAELCAYVERNRVIHS